MSKAEQSLQIGVGGMTCAACVRRVEIGLRKIPNVADATVNLATERASVRFDQDPNPGDMDAVRSAIAKLGYQPVDLAVARDAHARDDHDVEIARQWRMFVGAASFTVPIVVLAMAPMVSSRVMDLMMRWLSMEHWNWIMLALTIPVQFWFGGRFLHLGAKSLFSKAPDMNSLILLGTMAAFIYSTIVTIVPQWISEQSRHVYFEASAVVITLILLGKYLETKSRHQASDAMKVLLNLVPKMATVVRNGQAITIPAEDVLLNDLVEVRPGSAIAVDGVVVSGSTHIDESMVTGESLPVAKEAGDEVVAGTINGNGSIQFRATAIGAETTLAKIVAFVESAQASKPRIQSIADRVVAYFVPVVLLIALMTALAWLYVMPGGSVDQALIHAVAVLIIACPCAMGLAVPTSVMVGTGKAAQHGILFRSTDAIESLSQVDLIAFDKTGTLTVGKPQLSLFNALPPFTQENLLSRLAVVEQRSEHPLAAAIVDAAATGQKSPLTLNRFQAIAGAGVESELSNGDQVLIGSEKLMRERHIDTATFDAQVADAMSAGSGYFFAAVNHSLAALMVVSDPIKPSTPGAVEQLKQTGFKVALISGDNQRTALSIADRCGIPATMVYAEVRPNDKAEVVQTLKHGGQRVAFVGDGLNDAPALTIADVGIAMGTGTDLAIESADVIAMSGDLQNIPRAIRLSRAVMLNIKQNLAWAFGYNILLIPIATGLLKPITGLSLSPIAAGLAMSLSSFFVVTNALRLRRWH
ncbi:MAG TPA: heavy metal translocating P-type ATPase [Planctomycetaceae bacterium]|nr:heavy metal translocating P-type ATPase [Planctomycetaceae bacterium]